MARRRRSTNNNELIGKIILYILFFPFVLMYLLWKFIPRKIILYLVLFCILVSLFAIFWPGSVALVVLYISWKIYVVIYFKSEKFLAIKKRIQAYVDDCNALNQHIEDLKETPLESNRLDLGTAEHHDNSKWSVKRPKMQTQKYAPNVYNCSKTVCANARNKPFDYVCKYFGIRADEETLEKFENILNNFEAAEDGKVALQSERERIIGSIQNEIPALIKKFCQKRIVAELGFDAVDFETAYFPRYEFIYVSPGGNVGDKVSVVMDIEQLNRFVVYLAEKIKFKQSAAGQRALMTSKLREQIKLRDSYTCQHCGISTEDEPHLLLEIDHIVPIAKGGLTTEDNLQTLCWKCNRSKGSKLAEA